MHRKILGIGRLATVALVAAIALQAIRAGTILGDEASKKAELLEGQQGAVLDAVTSRDGRLLVSAGRDGSVRVWDLAAKKQLLCLRGHEGAVRSVLFTPDGAKLLSRGEDGTLRLWDATTGKLIETFSGFDGPVSEMLVAPDGRQLIACGSDGTIRIWPLPAPKRAWEPAQAAGLPDTPRAGDQSTAWASATPDGQPQAPNEDIHVYLMDEEVKVLHDLAYPYRTFDRGEDRWYALAVDSLKVPERFCVGFFFNAHRTKGVYMGKGTDIKESHSFYGTPEKGYKPVDGNYDWMVRTYFMPGD